MDVPDQFEQLKSDGINLNSITISSVLSTESPSTYVIDYLRRTAPGSPIIPAPTIVFRRLMDADIRPEFPSLEDDVTVELERMLRADGAGDGGTLFAKSDFAMSSPACDMPTIFSVQTCSRCDF